MKTRRLPQFLLAALPKDGIPAIDRPRFVGAQSAKLDADDRVLGISLGGVARAP